MDFQKKYFGFNESMMPWINRHWDTLQVGEVGGLPNWVWVTKAPFINFSVMQIYDIIKLYVKFFKSCSYLPGVSAASGSENLGK